MLAAAKYSSIEALRDGRRLEIRALGPDDRADLLATVDRSSGQSLYRRFFAVRRGFTEPEIAFFLNPDFVDHVALVAGVEESARLVIAGGHVTSLCSLERPRWLSPWSTSTRARYWRGTYASSRRDCPWSWARGTDR